MPTKQETFDTVARHLLTQGAPALRSDRTCVYRTENGLKCAVGCLIPDSVYDPRMEEHTIGDAVVDRVVRLLGHDLELCGELQNIHDVVDTELSRSETIPYWKSELRRIAREFGLDDKIVDELP